MTWVTGEDADHLCRLVEEKDGGPAWIQMMDRSTSTMSYQAWRRDPEVAIHSFVEIFYHGFVALIEQLDWLMELSLYLYVILGFSYFISEECYYACASLVIDSIVF